MVRAVVFDLWQTLAMWPDGKSTALRRAWSEDLGVSADRLDEAWNDVDFYRVRETGPIRRAIGALFESLGVEGDIDDIVARRLELARDALVPVAGAVSTLHELRSRGVATGLVSNCTEEVALVWDESPFAGLVDASIFSATAGYMKPDARIYELVLAELDVSASETLFVGDGANDELEGARRIGMTPVLVHAGGESQRWDGLREWAGHRITAIPEVLSLLE